MRVLINLVEFQLIIVKFITQLMFQSVKNVKTDTPYIQIIHASLAIISMTPVLNALLQLLSVFIAQLHFLLGVIGGENYR